MLAILRRRAVALRDAVHRRLHPGRRRRAIERFRSLDPSSVLFVCLGNVCRSPYAERTLAALVGPAVHVDSSGFIGPGRAPPDKALAAAKRRGVVHDDHRSKTVDADALRDADAVFVFDRYNAADVLGMPGVDPDRVFWLGDLDPQWSGKRAIIDPWGRDDRDFDAVFERIDRCVGEVASLLELPGEPPEPL